MPSPSEYFGPVPVVSGYVPALVRLTASQQLGEATASNVRTSVVTDGHWWRIIGASCLVITSAVAGSRQYALEIVDASGAQTVFSVFAPNSQPPSYGTYYTVGPNLTGFASPGTATASGQQVPIPDLLWPGGTTFYHRIYSYQAGDTFGVSPSASFVIEDYIEANLLAQPGQPLPLQL